MATATRRRPRRAATNQWNRSVLIGEHAAVLRVDRFMIALDIPREAAQALLARGDDWRLVHLDDADCWAWISSAGGSITLSYHVRRGLPDGSLRYTWIAQGR